MTQDHVALHGTMGGPAIRSRCGLVDRRSNAGVRRLTLSHLIPWIDPDCGPKDWQGACAGHFDGELIVGYDSTRIEL